MDEETKWAVISLNLVVGIQSLKHWMLEVEPNCLKFSLDLLRVEYYCTSVETLTLKLVFLALRPWPTYSDLKEWCFPKYFGIP